MRNNCPFCMEMKNYNLNPLKKNRIVLETEHFVVFPTVGCLVVNYVLIVPKKHYTCFGHLSDIEHIELNALINELQFKNRVIFENTTIMFEHGSTEENPNAGNSVYHAHLHVLPFAKSLKDDVVKDGLVPTEIGSIHELYNTIKKMPSYLYYHDTDGKDYEIPHAGVESQYFRRLVSKNLDLPDKWNWREYPFIENMYRTLILSHELTLCS